MATENTFLDRVQRANELKTAVTAMSPGYAPADPKFALTAFTTAITAANAAITAVDAARPPYQDQTADRAALVKAIGPLVTQALAYVKSNTVWANRFEAVKKAADKVRGISPRKPAAEPDPEAKTRETGEQSYVEVAAHFKAFIDRLDGLGGYAPADVKIGIDELSDDWSALAALNTSIPGLSRTLADAIADRQTAFAGATGLKFVFDGVKVSVKGQYGQTSAQFLAISGIKW